MKKMLADASKAKATIWEHKLFAGQRGKKARWRIQKRRLKRTKKREKRVARVEELAIRAVMGIYLQNARLTRYAFLLSHRCLRAPGGV